MGPDSAREGGLMQYPNQCDICAHRTEGEKCKAFPDGIPADIRLGFEYHTKPQKGDGGIRYEPTIAAARWGVKGARSN